MSIKTAIAIALVSIVILLRLNFVIGILIAPLIVIGVSIYIICKMIPTMKQMKRERYKEYIRLRREVEQELDEEK